MKFPIHMNGIMYARNIVNGPNIIPLAKTPKHGAIMTGNSLYPFKFSADITSIALTNTPTICCGCPMKNGRKKLIVV